MSITTALKARREALRDREAGFTLIELLVVVIIIGILAAIAIPIYVGVQNNAKDSGVKSDLGNQKTAVVAFETNSAANALPTASDWTNHATTLDTYGWTMGSNIQGGLAGEKYIPAATGTTFCIVAQSVVSGHFFQVTSSGSVSSATSLTCTPA